VGCFVLMQVSLVMWLLSFLSSQSSQEVNNYSSEEVAVFQSRHVELASLKGKELQADLKKTQEVSSLLDLRNKLVQEVAYLKAARGELLGDGKCFDTQVKFPILITTARRSGGAFYLKTTLQSLKDGGKDPKSIMILNVERGNNHVELEEYLASEMYKDFPVHVIRRSPDLPSFDEYVKMLKSGNRHPLREYPFAFRTIDEKHNFFLEARKDPTERKYWRTKENLDFVYLCREGLRHYREAKFFLFLEDDMAYKSGQQLDKLLEAMVTRKPGSGLVSMPKLPFRYRVRSVYYLSDATTKAALMHKQYLESLIGFTMVRHDYFPLDWMMDMFNFRNKQPNPPHIPVFEHLGEARSIF